MSKNVRRSGFTLPEILVTVTVIAVLAAAVVPAVTQYVTKGNTPASQQDIQQLQNAVTAFTADVRRYPGDLAQLTNTIVSTTGPLSQDASATPVTYTALDVTKWKGPYTSAPITSAAGSFTSAGLAFTIGRTISLTNNWLVTPITAPASSDCTAILALDKALDGTPSSAGAENSTGIVVWTQGANACDAAGVNASPSAVTNLVLRLVPAT
jgi:prepilin-type N-terminal cleavage/methylation domain-containing protein